MKKTLIALAVLAPWAASSAQTANVTLFGVADGAIRTVRNQGLATVNSVVSGSNSTSRWGLRGSEDLGSGLRASFWLESGYSIDNGANITNLFDRRATVSLHSNTAGELRLGRDFVPSYVGWSRFDPFSYVGVGGTNNFVSATPLGPIRTTFGSNPNTTVRSSNSIQYFLPSGLAGVEGALIYAPDEGGTAANGLHVVKGARVGYVSGPINASLAHTVTSNSLNVGSDLKDTAVGVSYDFKVAKIAVAHRQFKMLNAKQANLLIAVTAPVGSGEFKASYNRADMKGSVGATVIDANDAQQIALGYVHNLSKRSALYGTYSRISNKGAATFVVPGGASGIAGGRRSTGIEIGMRHNF